MFRDIEAQVTAYLAQYPGESFPEMLGQFADEGNDPDWPYLLRHNMRGHITCSAFVLNKAMTHALIVDHKAQGIPLQPGGHWEGDVTLQEGARRETLEETGIICQIIDLGAPLDIHSHGIKARPEKSEGEHRHHDFCYLAIADNEVSILPQEEEVGAVNWVSIADLIAYNTGRVNRLARKAQAWIDRQAA